LADMGRNRQFSQGVAELLDYDCIRGYQKRKCRCHDEVTPGWACSLPTLSLDLTVLA
jgi:hypothetical protein